MPKTVLVTKPSMLPVLLADVKSHLNVDWDDDDFLIEGYILAAVDQVENILNRKLITQTWKVLCETWPEEYFSIPFGKLQSVTHVKYKDTSAVESTLAATEYISDIDSDPGRVVLGYNKLWPTTELYPSNPITIQFVCGYGDIDDVPYPIKSAIMLMAGDFYAHRESIIVGSGQMVSEIPGYIMNLLGSYRLWDGFK